jgi:hypothetical protein
MDDTAMETVSQVDEQGPVGIRNAPALPAAPKFSGATMQDRREFMRQYETYCHALSAFETTGVRVYRVPVSVCIDERTRLIIANYEFGKPAHQVTETEWVSYFEQARTADHIDYEVVDEAMKKLKMVMSLRDAPSRMGKLVADMHKILDSTNMEVVLTEQEPKKLVEYLVEALEPVDFRTKIKARLKQEANKYMRKNPVVFVKWVTELLREYMLWETRPSTDETPTPRPAVPKRAGGGTPHP